MTNLAELSRLAKTLNIQTDLYTRSLTELESDLVSINLGIEAWVVLKESAVSGTPERDTRIRTLFGFARVGQSWGFAVQDLRVERGFFQGDSDCPYENCYEEAPPKPLLGSSRELRVDAADKVEELLDALKQKAERTIPVLKEAITRIAAHPAV